MSTVVLCTLVLNEMEWLPKLYEQHKDWPGMLQWIFVEAADRVYAETNPELVSAEGLSVDGTSEFLGRLAIGNVQVTYIPFGLTESSDPAQGKCAARTVYLQEADKYEPDFLWVLDADEFYTKRDQKRIMEVMDVYRRARSAFCFKHRHPWHPPSVRHLPWNSYEVRGGFWDIPLCRGWRWERGLVYESNHNTPQAPDGRMLDGLMKRFDGRAGYPECVHMAFAADVASRHAKHAYYAARGEGRVDFRGWYVKSRTAYETWKPGDVLPRGAQVVPYSGVIPEAFRVKKPVCDPKFWGRRILSSRESGREMHTAIYDIDPETWSEIQRQTRNALLVHVKPGDRVLDAGCGYGALADCLQSSAEYVGVDSSPDMIDLARLTHPDRSFMVADLTDLATIKDGYFNWAVLRSVRDMIQDNAGEDVWDRIDKEVRRVARRVMIIEYESLPITVST